METSQDPAKGPAVDLVDGHGRIVRDLRISVTDRCNFRCTYCMPAEGMTWMSRDDILTYEEIERVARICVERFGVDSIRLTGGEPTVRAHLPRLISRLAALRLADGRRPDLALTTNGATLRNIAGELKDAGLDRVNVSLDTLQRERFLQMTRRDELDNVLAGIAEARNWFEPVKVNSVVERGMNDDEIVDLARYGRDNGVEVRFIEFMPLDATNEWERAKVVTQDEIVARINEVFPLEPVGSRGAAPADRWRYVDMAGDSGTDGHGKPGSTVGVIPSVSHPFCGDCDRVRLTSDGQFRTCLFATEETDLRSILRRGRDSGDGNFPGTIDTAIDTVIDDEIAGAIIEAVRGKWAGHQIGRVNFVRPVRTMSQIGG